MIHIIIPVFNAKPQLEACLASLRRQSYREFTITIVDDGSRDGSWEWIRERYPEVRLVKGTGDWWWTRSMNEGLAAVLPAAGQGDFILSLNIDLYVGGDYLERLLELESRLRPCVLGSLNVDQDQPDRIVFAGVQWNPWTARYRPVLSPAALSAQGVDYYPTDMLPGRGTLFPIEVFRKLGGYDADHLPQYAADDDMSIRARKAGYRLAVCAGAKVFSNVKSTGLNFRLSGQASLRAFLRSLGSIRSPFYLKARFHFGMTHGKIGPLYVLLDLIRILGGFARFRLRMILDAAPVQRAGESKEPH